MTEATLSDPWLALAVAVFVICVLAIALFAQRERRPAASTDAKLDDLVRRLGQQEEKLRQTDHDLRAVRMRATVGEAISFEKAWAEVVKKVNDAPNPEALQQLQRTVAKTAIDLGLPRNGLAEMTAEAGAAGIKFQDLERYVRLAAKASVGWDMAPREAAQNLAEIKSAGQLTIAEMETLGDKINALGDNSAAKERDIVEMFQRAAEGARLAGSSMDTTLAALTALKSGGMQPEVAARFYQAFTSKLRTAGGEGKAAEKVNDALKELGLNGKKIAQDMARDADTTITQILERIGKHADPVKVAKGLMGEEWWDELAKFTGGSLAEFKKQRDFLRDPANFKGSLTKNLDTQLSTTANHLERLKALTGDVGDRLGRWALPGINRAIQGAIQQMDELDRRRALADAEMRARGEDPKQGDPIGRATTAAMKAGAWAKDKFLDHLVAPLPTQDPSRALVQRRFQEAEDEKELAKKNRAEADKLEERAKGTKDKVARKTLLEQAQRERESAARRDAKAAEGMRGVGPAGARDMTDVEFGEAAARASIETKRRIALLERGLGAGNQPNVRIPDTGVIMSRQAAEAELLALRKRFEALGGPPAEPQAPAQAPVAPVMTVPLPPARPGPPAPATPLPPARPASLTPPPAPVRPDATVQPAPTIQPQPTIQPAPVAPQEPQEARPAPVVGPAGEVAGTVAALQQRIGILERALAGGGQANVRIPDTGIITARRGVEAEIADLRRRVGSQRPAPAAPVPEQPAAPVPAPPASVPPAPAPAPAVAPVQARPAMAPAPGGEVAGSVAALQQRIGVLERALAGGGQANVRIPDTGIITARRGVEAEIADLRRRVGSQRPAPAAPVPEQPAAPVPAPPASVPPAPAPAPAVAPVQARPAMAPAPGGEVAGSVAALQQRIGVLERALAGGGQANVRIPDTGIITARRGVEAEIADLRRRVESPRPAPAAPGPERPAATAQAPAPVPQPPRPAFAPQPVPPIPAVPPIDIKLKFDPQPALDGIRAAEDGAKRLKTTMGQDLSGPARESMQGYTAAIQAGTDQAIAAAIAAAARIRAALSFTATPTIAPRLVMPPGGAATPAAARAGRAPGRPAATTPVRSAPAIPAAPAAPTGNAPRLQSASLRRGGGGVTINGPIHVHGVQNVASLHRQISRAADRRARDARDGALHDTGVESA